MSLEKKLLNKIARREKKVKRSIRGRDQYEKSNQRESTLESSSRAFSLMRKPKRREDSSMGRDVLAKEPRISMKLIASSLVRHDYGVADYGMQATFAANLLSFSGVQVGDVVQVLQQGSKLESKYLSVVALTDSTHLRLEDAPSLSIPAKPEITSVTTVADSAGSLNSTYFLLSTHTTDYYVWYNVAGAGVDPAVGGRTGIPVAISTGATAAAVATATKSALDAVSGAWTTSRSSATLTITNQAAGTATDAADGTAATGFSISVTQQGAAANPTPAAETNVSMRIEISGNKKSYF